MTADLSALIAAAQDWLWLAFVVFLRVGAVVSLAPAFGEQSVSVRVKFGLAAGFTLLVLPAVRGIGAPPDKLVAVLAFCGAEVVTGLFFGILLRLFVLALQTAGTIAAQSASISQLVGGSAAEPQPAMGNVLVVGGIALAALLGLHVQLAAYLIDSYALLPPGTVPTPAAVMTAGLPRIGACFALAFTLAAPFVIAAFLYNLILGVINRAMPQLMVTLIGAPALTLGGLGLFMLAAPLMLAVWAGTLADFLALPFGAGR